MDTTPTPTLLPAGPMARLLGVPVRWLKAEAEAGRIPHVKAETVFLFDVETVERVLLDRARQGGPTHAA
jgi:hypothetical protein